MSPLVLQKVNGPGPSNLRRKTSKRGRLLGIAQDVEGRNPSMGLGCDNKERYGPMGLGRPVKDRIKRVGPLLFLIIMGLGRAIGMGRF